MNKFLSILLSIVLVIASVTLVTVLGLAISNGVQATNINTTNRQFKAIQVYDGFNHGTITVDMDTKIMYMTNIGPLYNNDGSFKIYEGN